MNENKIKEAIDTIEVDQYQKNRMYNNILEKANKKKHNSINPSLLRYGLSFCCLLILACIIIVPKLTTEESILSGNPFMEVDGPKDFKDIGINIDAPENATDKNYIIIDEQIAYITFKVDGIDYEIKTSQQQGDFTGINGTIAKQESIDSKYNAVLYIINTDTTTYQLINWTNGKVSFNLYSEQCEENSLIEIYNSIQK